MAHRTAACPPTADAAASAWERGPHHTSQDIEPQRCMDPATWRNAASTDSRSDYATSDWPHRPLVEPDHGMDSSCTALRA